jgi:hypothetical protein
MPEPSRHIINTRTDIHPPIAKITPKIIAIPVHQTCGFAEKLYARTPANIDKPRHSLPKGTTNWNVLFNPILNYCVILKFMVPAPAASNHTPALGARGPILYVVVVGDIFRNAVGVRPG